MKFKLSRRLVTMLIIGQVLIDIFLVVSLWTLTRLTDRMTDALEFLLKGGMP